MSSINKLYSVKNWQKKTDLQAKVKGYSDTFDIDLTDNNGKPDCCIGHFGYNMYLRTYKGIKCETYKSLQTMARAIRQVFKNNGLEIESIGIKKYNKYRLLAIWNYDLVNNKKNFIELIL